MTQLMSAMTNLTDGLMGVPVVGWPLKKLSDTYVDFVQPTNPAFRVDFDEPGKLPLRVGPDSMMWRVYANPGVMYMAGVSAVLMEMAEECTRTGVLDFSTFKKDPIGRLKRTGSAAVTLLFGTEEAKAPLVKRVRAMHEHVEGETPKGTHFVAVDPDLLRWTYVTFSWSALQAYMRYLDPGLPVELQDQFYRETSRGTVDFGTFDVPLTAAETNDYICKNHPPFEHHEFLTELMAMFRKFPGFEYAAPLLGLLTDGAYDFLPDDMIELLDLHPNKTAQALRRPLITGVLKTSNVLLRNSQAQRACRREGVDPEILNHRPALSANYATA